MRQVTLAHAPHATVADLYDDCVAAAMDDLMVRHGAPAWDEAAFEVLLAAVGGDLVDEAVAVGTAVGRILTEVGDVERRLDQASSPALAPTVADVRRQLDGLLYPGFVQAAGVGRLSDLARYLLAVDRRLEKAVADPRRDQQLAARVHAVERAYDRLLDSCPPGPVPEPVA